MVVTRSQSGSRGLTRIMHEIGRRRRFRKRYKTLDVTHRHRLPDRQRKSVRVVS